MKRIRIVTLSALIAVLLAGGAAVAGQGPGGSGFRGRGPGGPGPNGFGPGFAFDGLELTEAQQLQMRQLMEQYREQMFAILTPEQQALVQQRREAREARMKERLERMQQRLQN
ncbi:MAG: hypothetical protein HY657_05610 [Acidobacteria bacterium]|nr:hypothetical protein [Acidobacteriota bacterium]